jgi:hypothetical protein
MRELSFIAIAGVGGNFRRIGAQRGADATDQRQERAATGRARLQALGSRFPKAAPAEATKPQSGSITAAISVPLPSKDCHKMFTQLLALHQLRLVKLASMRD